MKALLDKGWVTAQNFKNSKHKLAYAYVLTPSGIDAKCSQTPSFCYVDDLVDGCVRLTSSPDELPGPINLGNPGELTRFELAEAAQDHTVSRSAPVYEPPPKDDPERRRPEIGLADRNQLGWAAEIPLREGLEPAIGSFEDSLRRQR